MTKTLYKTSLLILIPASLVVVLESYSLSVSQSELTVSTAEQIKADFAEIPCKNANRLRATQALFEKMGTPSSDIAIERYKKVENLVIRKEGMSQGIIVVGAHYDKVMEGCGAIDNWSGIVVLAHLYRSIRKVPTRKTILFVAFGDEEKGRLGSRAMVATLMKDELPQYCEMINVDSVGLGAPQAADNLSSKKLTMFTRELAAKMKIPFGHASILRAEADSQTFLGKNIPSITIHGLTERWPQILHTNNDEASQVKHGSVYLAYQLVLKLMLSLDSASCAEYR